MHAKWSMDRRCLLITSYLICLCGVGLGAKPEVAGFFSLASRESAWEKSAIRSPTDHTGGTMTPAEKKRPFVCILCGFLEDRPCVE